MQLYNLPLNPSTAILKTVYGNFTSPKAQELIIAKTKSLQLYSVSQQGKLKLITIEQVFAVIRTVVAFRYHGVFETFRDSLILGTDSGKLIILQYDQKKLRFRKTHEQTFGKSGCRRIIPGQYIAVDPRGRAIMIAAVEKQKFVYVMQRKQQQLIIHSPREAHKSHSICVDMIALDNGSDNAVFACIQMDYGEVEDKQAIINKGGVKKSVVYYEMDFGMNTVIRKKQQYVDPTAHMLISVPNAPDGPGGLIVVLEDYLSYRGGGQEMMLRLPIRKNRLGERKNQFTCHCVYKFKGFFFLISNELGDLFKVQFVLKDGKGDKKEAVLMRAQYFDSTYVLTSMSLTKNGFLFCAAEKQDHLAYMIVKSQGKSQIVFSHSQMAQNKSIQFDPVSTGILQQTDRLQQYGPMSDLKITDLKQQGNPQIYAINSSGSFGKSYLRIIKQGIKVDELMKIKYHSPQDIWCIKNQNSDHLHKMIIISLVNKTLVLTTTQKGFAQTKDTGIQENQTTIHVGRLEDNSLVQIIPGGFRHIRVDRTVRTMKFQGRIVKGTTKGRQMILALAGGDLLYYELDQTGSLAEAGQTLLDSQVISLDFSPVQIGRVRSSFLTAALSDGTARLFELGPQNCLRTLSSQNMRSPIESIMIQQMDVSDQQNQRYGIQLYLYAGLQNGMIVRTTIDPITGKLTDSRPKYLGARPVKLVRFQVQGRPAILGLSSRPWLFYSWGMKQMRSVLSSSFIHVASMINTPGYSHTLMVYNQNHLRIFKLQNFGKVFHCQKIPLDYSGKKLMVFQKNIAVIESQQDWKMKKQTNSLSVKQQRVWHSQVSIYSGKQTKRIANIQMEQDEACVSFCYLTVQQNEVTQSYIVIGTVKSMRYHPSFYIQTPKIKTYKWNNKSFTFQLQHETQIQDIPLVLYTWKNKILAGVGCCLRYYQIGKKRLLRKGQVKNLSSPVNTIRTWGQRIFATQVNDSFHMYKYKAKQQTFYDIADDVLNRYITTTAILDYHTVIGADKFQNIFVSRVPPNAEDDFQNNPNSYKFRWQNGYLNGAPFKMDQICSFYVGQVVTSIQKAALATSGSQILIYSTINGGIYALCPFESREDVDFFTHLQLYMRNLSPSLAGRDFNAYRSYYSPCKAVVDGQICEVFNRMTYDEQVQIARHLDRTPNEIQKKLQEIRNRLL